MAGKKLTKPWQKPELLVKYPPRGVWVRTRMYDKDHLVHRDYTPPSDDPLGFIAWCGRPLVVRAYEWMAWHEEEFGPFGPFKSTRTSDASRCPECRRKEKEFLAG